MEKLGIFLRFASNLSELTPRKNKRNQQFLMKLLTNYGETKGALTTLTHEYWSSEAAIEELDVSLEEIQSDEQYKQAIKTALQESVGAVANAVRSNKGAINHFGKYEAMITNSILIYFTYTLKTCLSKPLSLQKTLKVDKSPTSKFNQVKKLRTEAPRFCQFVGGLPSIMSIQSKEQKILINPIDANVVLHYIKERVNIPFNEQNFGDNFAYTFEKLQKFVSGANFLSEKQTVQSIFDKFLIERTTAISLISYITNTINADIVTLKKWSSNKDLQTPFSHVATGLWKPELLYANIEFIEQIEKLWNDFFANDNISVERFLVPYVVTQASCFAIYDVNTHDQYTSIYNGKALNVENMFDALHTTANASKQQSKKVKFFCQAYQMKKSSIANDIISQLNVLYKDLSQLVRIPDVLTQTALAEHFIMQYYARFALKGNLQQNLKIEEFINHFAQKVLPLATLAFDTLFMHILIQIIHTKNLDLNTALEKLLVALEKALLDSQQHEQIFRVGNEKVYATPKVFNQNDNQLLIKDTNNLFSLIKDELYFKTLLSNTFYQIDIRKLTTLNPLQKNEKLTQQINQGLSWPFIDRQHNL